MSDTSLSGVGGALAPEKTYEEVTTTIGDLLALLPSRELDYSDKAIQIALDLEAEKRLRMRGLLGPSACASLRKRIIKKASTR